MWALSYYLTQLSLGCQSSCQQTPRGLETRCVREGHTRPRGPSESPDGVDPNIRGTRTTQRNGHNSGVKIWSLCSISSILSHANLSNPYNKERGEYFSKEVFLRPLFVRLSFIMHLLSLRRYVSSIYMYATYIFIFQSSTSKITQKSKKTLFFESTTTETAFPDSFTSKKKMWKINQEINSLFV